MSGQWLESGRKAHLNLDISLLSHTTSQAQSSPPHTRQGEIQGEGSWNLNPHCPSPPIQLLGVRRGCRPGPRASRALTCSAFPGPDASLPAQGSGELVPRREWWLHRRLRRSAAPGHVRACVTKELSRSHPPSFLLPLAREEFDGVSPFPPPPAPERRTPPSKSLLYLLPLSWVLSNLRAYKWPHLPALGICSSLVICEGLHPPNSLPGLDQELLCGILSPLDYRNHAPHPAPCCTKQG